MAPDRLTRRTLWALAVALVVLLVLVAVAAAAEPVAHVHASGRYSRSPASLRHALDGYAASVITVTEVRERPRARVLHTRPGWGALTPAPTDAGITWRRDRWRLVGRDLYRLAHRPPRDTWALSAVLAPRPPYAGPRVLVTVSHLPSGVEQGGHWSPLVPNRVAAWRAAVPRWHAHVGALARRYAAGLVLVAADWNVNLRRPVWRRIVTGAFPALRLTWRPLPSAGTFGHGGRVIDATLTNGAGRARLLPRTPASDHRPYFERLESRTPRPDRIAPYDFP